MDRVALLCTFVLMMSCLNGHAAIFGHFVNFAALCSHVGRHVEKGERVVHMPSRTM